MAEYDSAMTGTRAYVSPHRERAAARTRALILHHAARLFAERGYARVTVADIAAAAGVAAKTVFASVGSKAEVFNQIVDEGVEDSGYMRTVAEVGPGRSRPVPRPQVTSPAPERRLPACPGRNNEGQRNSRQRISQRKATELDYLLGELRLAAGLQPRAQPLYVPVGRRFHQPTDGATLNPCPLNPEAITRPSTGLRQMTGFQSGVTSKQPAYERAARREDHR